MEPTGCRSAPSHPRLHRARLIVPAAVVALTVGCWQGDDTDISVRLASGAKVQPSAAPAADTATPVRFAYASVLSPERSTLTYAHLGRFLSGRLGRRVEIVRRRTYGELNELLRTSKVDAGLVCTGAFAVGRDGFGLEAVVVPVVRGETTYHSYVITRRDSGRTSFEDLKGAVFAFTDPLSNTGYRYVMAKLHGLGVPAEEFFGRTFFTFSHDNSVEAVVDGIADAGSIDSLVWDHLVRADPTLERDLVIIDRSEPFPINPIAIAPATRDPLRNRLILAFLEMHKSEAGRALLEELGVDRFERPTPKMQKDYDAIARSWEELKLVGPETEDGSG